MGAFAGRWTHTSPKTALGTVASSKAAERLSNAQISRIYTALESRFLLRKMCAHEQSITYTQPQQLTVGTPILIPCSCLCLASSTRNSSVCCKTEFATTTILAFMTFIAVKLPPPGLAK